MATRIYLPSTGAPPVSPAWDGAWDVTTNADRIRAVANLASGTPMSSKSTTETAAGAVNVLSRQYLAGPLGAGEISGTVKGRIRAQEANADADYRAQIVIRVVSEDGATVRGTLRAADAEALSSEFSTSLANRAFPLAALEPQALTPVTAQAGDWLVIEIGYRSHNEHTTSRTGTFRYGDVAAADCAENETGTSDYNPWIEFSQDLPLKEIDVRQVVGEVASLVRYGEIDVRQVLAEVAHLYRGTGPEVRVRQVLAEVAWTPVAGDLYAVGNDLGEYEGEERGVPLSSDRSAWDDVDYPTRHARGMAAGDTHHREVTLGEESDPILTLNGQELTLGDVATQAELDAHAGTPAAHHDPVTLSPEAADILALLGQEIDLEAQAANTVLAGPASGADAKPTFRSLVAADLGTGTPDGTQFLRDDMTWQYVQAGGGGGSGTPAGYAETIGDGVETEYTVTHSLGTWDVIVQLYDLGVTPREQVDPKIEVTSADAVVVTFESAPDEDQYRVLVVAADVSAVGDAADLTYTPAELADWDSDADPGDAADALDQLAKRVDDLEAGGGGGVTVAEEDGTPSVAANTIKFPDGSLTDNGDGSVSVAFPAGGTVDAGDVTYAPTTAADWDGSVDPGNADDALDQLAERVADLEGAAGGASGPDEPPAVPNAMDDEFDGEVLDEKWGWINKLDSTATLVNGRVILLLSSTSDRFQGIYQAAPAGNWCFRAKLFPGITATQYRYTGLFAQLASTTGAFRAVGPGDRAASGSSGSNPVTAGTGATVYSGPGFTHVYVEMEWDGTNVIWRESATGDAGTYEEVYRWAPGAAPVNIGIGGGTYQQTAALKTRRTAEWFRRIA